MIWKKVFEKALIYKLAIPYHLDLYLVKFNYFLKLKTNSNEKN